ncbi:MAG: DUF4293 domain-containing protein [Bacteroidales bacterium]|nr:DUF4293 domain-containing protein [Bacteroidales bacterium]
MIQRIQTLYLLLAACAFALCFMFPIATYIAPVSSTQQTIVSELNLFPKDVISSGDQFTEINATIAVPQKGFINTWILIVLIIVCIGISTACIFLYHNRVLQMRLAAIGFLLAAIYVFLIFIWAVEAYGKAYTAPFGSEAPAVTWSVGTWAPVAGGLLLFLAQRAIRKDEEKVRAADRLR